MIIEAAYFASWIWDMVEVLEGNFGCLRKKSDRN